MWLFTKTWKNDYPWLKLAIKSVLKLHPANFRWMIVGDRGSRSDLEKLVAQAMQETKETACINIVEVQEYWPECDQIPNGYFAQQWIKMNAHRLMGDESFLNWDSDVIAVKPFTDDVFRGGSGRYVFWFSQFNHLIQSAPDKNTHIIRMNVMREIMAVPEISFEYMRCMPIPMNGGILRCGSGRAEWSRAFDAIRNGRGGFSEFNIIGMFSHLYFPDAYEWKNADQQGPAWAGGWDDGGKCFQAHAYVSQRWSWGGMEKHIEDFVNAL